MADKITEFQQITTEAVIPAADELAAANKGVVYADAILLAGEGEVKRGTLLMSSGENYVLATRDGIKNAENLCILCDDTTLVSDELAEVCAYFEGDFNDTKIIFPFETDEDNHAELVEAVREPLRAHKIFLRYTN